MLPDSGPSAPTRTPKPKPAPAAKPAPEQAVTPVRQGVQQVHRLLTFAPPKFDPAAVASARAQLEEALKPVEQPDEFNNQMNLGLGANASYNPEAAAASGRSLADDYSDSVSSARDQLAEALRSQRREAIGADKLDFTGKRDKVRKMTPEQYDALDPRQQQAIDFNTRLVRAVRRDLRLQDSPDYNHATDKQRDKYDDTVEDIFAEGRGSDTYAPETVALLKQIGFSDPQADLDDFLSLDAAIRPKDVKQMGGPAPTLRDAMRPNPEDQVDSPAQDRLNLSRQLAAHTARLDATLAKGQAVLQTMNATSTQARNPAVVELGGKASTVRTTTGFGAGTTDDYYRKAFELLADQKADPKQVLASINTDLGDLEGFSAYVSTRLANAEKYSIPLGGAPTVKYRTPEQIRSELGLGGGS